MVDRVKNVCPRCKSNALTWLKPCGATVCLNCGYHIGLERCYCGWSLTQPGRGREELIDMGENIDGYFEE